MLERNSSEDARFARPIVVVSRCLGFEACRFDGQMLVNRFVESLEGFVELRTTCPEAELGLGVPRPALRLVSTEDGVRLLQPATGRDLSTEIDGYNRSFLERHGAVDGFVLKNRSPSCAVGDARIYASEDRGPAKAKGSGAFASAMLRAFPHAAFEDEGRLTDPAIRHHFLTRIFTLAEFRERVRDRPSRTALVRFHSRHKHLLLACDESRLRRMGRLVARLEDRPLDVLIEDYAEMLGAALAKGPRRGATLNVLQHAGGYFSDQITAGERRHFEELLASFRGMRVPLSAVLSTLRAWVVRFGEEYIAEQSFYRPYPAALTPRLERGVGVGALVQP